MALLNSLFYVDSKAVLCSLNSTDSTVRSGIHCLLIKDAGVTFCWIPSHCGLTFNEWVDRAAKRGAVNNMQPTILDVPLPSKEMCNIIENDTWKRLGFSRSLSH